jgi:hypothetical protein
MEIELDEESKKMCKEFLEEFKKFNEHLQDYKKMVAPKLGFKVVSQDGDENK